jgi:hypothetical protein
VQDKKRHPPVGRAPHEAVQVTRTRADNTCRTDIYQLLGNERRLLVVRYLALYEVGVSLKVRHLARVIRGIEMGTPPEQVGTEGYETVYNGLIQRHLPKLAADAVLQYDDRGKVVTVTQRSKQYALIDGVTGFLHRFDSTRQTQDR